MGCFGLPGVVGLLAGAAAHGVPSLFDDTARSELRAGTEADGKRGWSVGLEAVGDRLLERALALSRSDEMAAIFDCKAATLSRRDCCTGAFAGGGCDSFGGVAGRLLPLGGEGGGEAGGEFGFPTSSS